MVYTVTLNPAIDHHITVDKISIGQVNRTKSERMTAGGKGINVSRMLNTLGIKNKALGFCGGHTGEIFLRMLNGMGVEHDFIHLENGYTRVNAKIHPEETELNGQGSGLTEDDTDKLYNQLYLLTGDDVLVLAGSLPIGISESVYADIIKKMNANSVRVIADAAGEALKKAVEAKPYLVKPNHIELGEIFGVSIGTRPDAVIYAKKLIKMGAENVLVSMAEQGAALVCKDGKVYETDAFSGKTVNTVGAGDAMLAGFIAGILKNGDMESALKTAVSAGSACAFTEEFPSYEEIMKLYNS